MVYETSHENGRKPFRADTKRGHWAAPSDFLYACWGLAFQMDIFSMSWLKYFMFDIYSLITYLCCMSLCKVPIVMIQSFLGQFSSSGFISVFRIAPLFKGMGYISLAINFMMLSHLSAFAAIPLFYLFHSMRPTLPWSCASFLQWSIDVPNEGHLNICNNKTYGTNTFVTTTTISPSSNEMFSNETVDYEYDYEYVYKIFHIPSAVYFRSLFKDYELSYGLNFSLSWELLLCMLLVWTLIAFIFYKLVNAEKIGKFIRFTTWMLVPLMIISLLRMVFLPHSGEALQKFFSMRKFSLENSLASIPVFILATFGTGWGNIISLSSYNKFRTNIMRYSWFIPLGEMVILLILRFTVYMIVTHYRVITDNKFFSRVEHHWLLYLASGSVLADLELPNLWSILFFSMLLLSALLILVIQLFSLLTAIFDEFEFLRPHRQEVTLTLIGLLLVCSSFFCSNHGLSYFTVLPADALFTQTALNLLLFLVILWIYGRVRFQRDIEFMLGQRFANWRVHVLRFTTPLLLLAALFWCIMIVQFEHYFQYSIKTYIAAFVCIVIPWLFVPGYAILELLQTTGSLGARFKRCCRPTDWYPVETEEHQRYEDEMGNMDVTHQLNEVGTETVEHTS